MVDTRMSETRSLRGSDFPQQLIGWGTGIPLLLVLMAASPLGTDFLYVIAGIPFLLLLWTVAASWSLVLCVVFAVRRQWRSSLQSAVLPVIVCVAGLHQFSFVRQCNYLGDVLHFVVARPYYEHVIANLPYNGHSRLAVFNWGGMIWASTGLVYDQSDEVALPPGKQSATWLANPALAELSCGNFGVRPLWAHYYLVSFPC